MQQRQEQGQQRKTLVVALLNYSGVLTSPYEYYDSQDIYEKQMSQSFAQIVNQKYNNFIQGKDFIWDMGSIDTKWKSRFCPVNIAQVGIKNGYLLTQQQFKQQWQNVCKNTIDSITKQYFQKKYKGDDLIKRKKIQIERSKEFDLHCYKNLIKVYYNIDLKDLPKRTSALKYYSKKRQEFNKPFLDEQLKIEKTDECINKTKYDIIFFQQANKMLIDTFLQASSQTSKDYYLIQKAPSDSIILLKKTLFTSDSQTNFVENNKKFLQNYSSLLKKVNNEDVSVQKLQQIFNFNKDSVFVTFGKYFILNIHLSSQKQKNPNQMKEVDAQLRRMRKILPDTHIIFGGDFNAKLDLTVIKQPEMNLNFTPQQQSKITVKKKRAFMQPQRNKANKLDQSAKDYLISTLKLKKDDIILIDGKKAQGSLLPNIHHPYDHYMIRAQFAIP